MASTHATSDDDQPLNLTSLQIEIKREFPMDLTNKWGETIDLTRQPDVTVDLTTNSQCSPAVDLTSDPSDGAKSPPDQVKQKSAKSSLNRAQCSNTKKRKLEMAAGRCESVGGQQTPLLPTSPPRDPSHLPLIHSLSLTTEAEQGSPTVDLGSIALQRCHSLDTPSFRIDLTQHSQPTRQPANIARFGHYGTRDRSSIHGIGFVLILANFLYELPGYRVDIESITNFFNNTLHFDVFGGSDCAEEELCRFRNLSRHNMLKTVRDAQKYLSNNFSRLYDRLFVFILSHGDQDGIMTCEKIMLDGRETLTKEKVDGTAVHVTEQEIVDMFTHDNVPTLFGYPKCFFFQNCRGNNTLHSAHGPIVQETGYVPPAAVGADTVMFHSSKLGYLSFVSDIEGSWFIKETMSNLREYYLSETETLIDIMNDVTGKISKKRSVGENGGHDGFTNQLPCIVCSLTKKLYLTIPLV